MQLFNYLSCQARTHAEKHGLGKFIPINLYPETKQQVMEKVVANLSNLTSSLTDIINTNPLIMYNYHYKLLGKASRYIDKAFNGADYKGLPIEIYSQYNEYVDQIASDCLIFRKKKEIQSKTDKVKKELDHGI